MDDVSNFFRDVLDGLPQHIAVVGSDGTIIWVNQAWSDFSKRYSGGLERTCAPANYLEECDRAAREGDDAAAEVSHGFRRVVSREIAEFSFEYPCNSATEIRWFLMRLRQIDTDLYVVSHENITEQKIAAQRLSEEARTDSLTGLANRRQFELFLTAEIKRAQRSEQSLSLMMIDVDHFKPFNDLYGHREGDNCLRLIGQALKNTAKRPSDIAARYGGEEFAVILMQTKRKHALRLAENTAQAVRDLRIPHLGNPTRNVVTVSIGLVVTVPTESTTNNDVVSLADHALYAAKKGGRDRVVLADLKDATAYADTTRQAS